MAINDNGLPFEVFNDYPIEKGTNRSKPVDLAVVSKGVSHTDILNGNSYAEFVANLSLSHQPKERTYARTSCPWSFGML